MIGVTNWTHEDMLVMFQRVNRLGADLQVLPKTIAVGVLGDVADAKVMERWQLDRRVLAGWGNLRMTPVDSKLVDMQLGVG